MGERKVQNRYFPPDFDPSLVPRRRWDPYKQVEVRMMLPFNMQCNRCGEFMYRGKKFNSRKEDAIGENYLGVRIYRFYIKCSQCSNEIAFKTDPKNMDYICESGATRNFESWKQHSEAVSKLESKKRENEQGNAMAALENRTMDSKIEMDILDTLDEIKAANDRKAHFQRDPQAIFNHRKQQAHGFNQDEEDSLQVFRALQNEKTIDDSHNHSSQHQTLVPTTLESTHHINSQQSTTNILPPTVKLKRRKIESAPAPAAAAISENSDEFRTPLLSEDSIQPVASTLPPSSSLGAVHTTSSRNNCLVNYASSSSSSS